MMKNLLCLLIFIPIAGLGQELYNIPDNNFLDYLQENYPEVIVNDSLDTDAAMEVLNISCDSNNINNLDGIQYFINLTTLSCSNNQLITLPNLPSGLTSLICGNNQLTSLPDLPETLSTLICANNQIASLPTLPEELYNLVCGSNLLFNIPELPSSIVNLICRNNQLTILPELPEGLLYLICGNNQLTILPELPSTLLDLTCRNNELTSLPDLPNQLTNLLMDNNPIICVNDYPSIFEELLGEFPTCDEIVGLYEVKYNTPHLIKMIDVLGREQEKKNKGMLLFYIYDNGTVEKRVFH